MKKPWAPTTEEMMAALDRLRSAHRASVETWESERLSEIGRAIKRERELKPIY